MGAFVDALCREAAQRATDLGGGSVRTVYLGGGTPSMLSPTHLERLFAGLRDVFDLGTATEITLEANPATFGQRTAGVFRDLGVTRISLGAQSFHPEHLRTLGREHAAEDIAASVAHLRQAGIPSVGIDLIFSVPGQTLSEWEQTLHTALALAPEHLSAYNLTYEEDTTFFDQVQAGRYRDDPSTNAAMFQSADRILTGAGFRHYETSNYARPGCESAHNRAYWTGADYLGLGPSAVSTINGRRWKNIPDTAKYMSMIDSLGHAESESEQIGPEEFRLERIALLLRTDQGVPLVHLSPAPTGAIEKLRNEGLAEIAGERLRLIGRGPLLVDSITEFLV